MTQEEKQLLLKDLCARFPYGVICRLSAKDADVSITEKLDIGGLEHFIYGTMDVKPYLRPMSSLIEKELEECRATCKYRQVGQSVLDCATPETIDYLISHHFDYRGLIPMGLALKAPKDMYAQK